MIEKLNIDLLKYRENICQNFEDYLSKAFDVVNSIPKLTETEAIAKKSFIVEKESNVNV